MGCDASLVTVPSQSLYCDESVYMSDLVCIHQQCSEIVVTWFFVLLPDHDSSAECSDGWY